LLSAIYESDKIHPPPEAIEPAHNHQIGLFDQRVVIPTTPEKSERVWQGLGKHLGGNRRRRLFEAFLSGRRGVETIIYQYARHALPGLQADRQKNRLTVQIAIDQLAQKVRREAHRLKGFIRFQQTGHNHYLALIAPRYDVLPLIRRHFETRFADQNWVIYDMQRNYGLCYDQHQTRTMTLAGTELQAMQKAYAKERDCQTLWRRYFAAATISLRDNPKLHLQRLPRRFWRYLPEKQS
jgi:probable DNA metabolism protein